MPAVWRAMSSPVRNRFWTCMRATDSASIAAHAAPPWAIVRAISPIRRWYMKLSCKLIDLIRKGLPEVAASLQKNLQLTLSH